MSLIEQIIEEAISKDSNVTRLLRLCLVLAHGLQHAPLLAWVRHELEGYPDETELPSYRVFNALNKGHFIGQLQGEMQIPITALPERIRKNYREIRYTSSVAECAQLVQNSSSKDKIKVDWPILLAVEYGSKLTPGSHCTGAWMEFSVASFVAVVDQVKTKVLAFALEIRLAYPDAGSIPAQMDPNKINEDKVNQIFNTTINGGQGISFGNQNVEQNIVNGVNPGDISSLISALEGLGLRKENALEIASLAEADRNAQEKGVGSRVKAWFEKGKDVAFDTVTGKGVEQIIAYASAAIAAYAG